MNKWIWLFANLFIKARSLKPSVSSAMKEPDPEEMKTGINGIKLIDHFEGCYLDSYLCPAKVPTIGIGTTRYESGAEVKLGEHITIERAYELLEFDLTRFEFYIKKNIHFPLLQHQFDALISLVYNIGIGNFLKSSVLRLVLRDPFDKHIPKKFMMWKFGGDGSKNGIDDDEDGIIDEVGEKQRLAGLIRRRKAEAHLYVTGELKFFEDE